MIWNAKSLQRVAKELREERLKDPESDLLLFEGMFLAGPILLSLAIEIALKAWQCRERKGKPEKTHDLLELFDGLEQDTRKLFEEGMLSFEPLPEILRSHKDARTHWRYSYEDPFAHFNTSALDRALTVILNAYDERWSD